MRPGVRVHILFITAARAHTIASQKRDTDTYTGKPKLVGLQLPCPWRHMPAMMHHVQPRRASAMHIRRLTLIADADERASGPLMRSRECE